jgi:hypothetical protein
VKDHEKTKPGDSQQPDAEVKSEGAPSD